MCVLSLDSLRRADSFPVSACASAKQMPPKGWTKPAQNVESVFSPTTRDLGESTFSPTSSDIRC